MHGSACMSPFFACIVQEASLHCVLEYISNIHQA